MAHTLELIQGDKRNPTRTLDLAAGVSTGSIFLRSGGFSPGPGALNVQWSGLNPGRDGQKRISSYRDNAQIKLTYDLNAGSVAELQWLQSEINRFFVDAGLYEEGAQGEPVWLRYRWSDGLDLPEPVFGQFSHFLRILSGDVPAWPGSLHNSGMLAVYQAEAIAANLVCRPYPEGLKQKVGTGIGQLEMGSHGLLLGQSVTNKCTNPSFGHATYDTGWTVSDATLLATQETRAGFTKSLDSSVHLRNQDPSNARAWRQSLTLTAVDYIISCYARRADGAAVTSSDMVLLGQGAAQTTTFDPVDGGPWYRAYATYTGVAAASTHGIQVKAGKEIYIDDIQIEIAGNNSLPTPFCAGHLIGCSWAGTAHASNSSRPDGVVKWTLGNELTGAFTIAGWVTPVWTSSSNSVDSFTVFEYYVDANNYILLYYNTALGTINFDGAQNATGYDRAMSVAITGTFHVALTNDGTNTYIYVNTTQSDLEAMGAALASGGTFYLGNNQAENVPLMGEMDGWRIWDRALSATEIDTLYDAEKDVKDTNGVLGMPAAFWTGDGDNVLDNALDSTYTNYGILVGVSGDVEALTRWEIDPSSGSPPATFWLGRKATDKPIDASILYAEFQGTVDGSSSEGEYNETAAGVTDFGITSDITTYLKYLPGTYQYLARMRHDVDDVVFQPGYHFVGADASQQYLFDTKTFTGVAAFRTRNLGDIIIRYPNEKEDIPSTVRLKIGVDRTTSTLIRIDCLLLLPWPFIEVYVTGGSYSPGAGQEIVIEEDRVWATLSSPNYLVNLIGGEPVNALPNKYNYIYHLQADEDGTWTISLGGTMTIYVTPQYLLPGGPIA